MSWDMKSLSFLMGCSRHRRLPVITVVLTVTLPIVGVLIGFSIFIFAVLVLILRCAFGIFADVEVRFQHGTDNRAGRQGAEPALFRQDGDDDARMFIRRIGDEPTMVRAAEVFRRPCLAGDLNREAANKEPAVPDSSATLRIPSRTRSSVDLDTDKVPTCSGAKILYGVRRDCRYD